jgi:probable rRNA maturation factor
MTDEPKEPGGARAHSVVVDDEQQLPVDVDSLSAWGARALAALAVRPDAALFVSLVSPERIAALKREALGVHRPTDVLSFPIDDPDDPSPGPAVLGDIVLCPAVAQAQARALGLHPDDELRRLLVHGLLHLLGRDHVDPATELAMAREARAVLERA